MSTGFKVKFNKKSLTNNIGLKLLSLVFSIVIWFVVVNITDPVVTQTYRNVQVKLLNENTVTDNGQTLEILDDSNVLSTVTIKAPRTVIQELGNSSDVIQATADISKISSDGTTVPIEITTAKYSDKVDSIRSSTGNLYVSIENRKSVQLPISVSTSGDIESGYIFGDITLQQNQVRISGPESVISTIKSANVDVDVTGFTDEISTQAEIVLLDEEGDEVPVSNLSMNIDSVKVNVEILATKRVPIYYAVSGTPQEGYGLTGEIECSPETIVIAGKESVIDAVSEINIPAADINVTGQTATFTTMFDMEDYLPTGTRLAEVTHNGKIAITVYIEEYVQDSYGIYLRNVTIDGTPEGYFAEIVNPSDNVEIVLTGLAQDLETLQLSSLNYRVDFDDYMKENEVSELDEGVYEMSLEMDLPDGVTLAEPVYISVSLQKNKD